MITSDRSGRDRVALLLTLHYGVTSPTFTPLLIQPEKQVYRVDESGRPTLVARAYATTFRADRLASDVAVLALLERHNFPAERLVRTHSGSLFVVDGALTILVTTFVGGNPVDYSPVSLGALAATVGRLHAIRIAQSDNGSLIRPAEMLPESELAYARRRLDGVANCVPPTFNERYHDIRAAINQFDVPGDLPVALLHNDCHPANARRLADGSVVLVDWEGAGWGPRVIDLGFLLVSGEIEAFRPNRLPANPARVGAIVDGYRDYIRPTMAELEWLPAAIRFRSIVAGAAAIADAIEANGLLEDRPWWWTRYQAADDIAERARRRFGG